MRKLNTIWVVVFMFVLLSCQRDTRSTENDNAKISFERISSEPTVPLTASTFYSKLVANPAVVEFKGTTYFIFRGQGEEGHDQIGMWTTPSDKADGMHWENHMPSTIIPVSTDPDSPDSQHILDPGVVVKGDTLFVYYTAKSNKPDPNYSICVAISTDGTTFNKYPSNPVIDLAIAPEAVYHDGLFYLFYQEQVDDHWEVFVTTSKNGIDFNRAPKQRVLSPSRRPGAFDAFSVATVRIVKEDDYFYMTYGASSKYIDYPESIGLARSTDLIRWELYAHNPVFVRGDAGTWDEGALWFPTVRFMQNQYVMWYEGGGTGLGLQTDETREASRIAREENYGGYLKTSFSQIGTAVFKGKFKDYWK